MRPSTTRRLIAVMSVSLVMAAMPHLAGASGGGRSSDGPARRAAVLRYEGPGGGPDYSTDIAVAPSGHGFFVTGYAYSGAQHGDDYTTIAYGAKGRQLWLRSYDGPDANIDQALALAVAGDGGAVFVTGYSFGGPATTNDATTVAYGAGSGEPLWTARYDGPGHDTDVGADIVAAPDGGMVFVTGASMGGDGMLDVLTIAYDATSGSQRWVARLGEGDAASDEGLSIGVSLDGSTVFVTGYQTAADADFLTAAYAASTGDLLWSRSIDAGGDELGRSLQVAPDGSAVYVTGYRSGVPGAGEHSGAPLGAGRLHSPLACLSDGTGVGDDYITVAYDARTGRQMWLTNYDGPDQDCDQAYAIAVAPDGSAVFVTGSSFSVSSDSDAATVGYATTDGSELWAARYDGPDHLYDAGDSVVVTPDGTGVFVAGASVGATTDYDFVTLSYDAITGGLRRSARYDGPGHGFDAPNAIAVDPAGRLVYVTGGSAGANLDPDYATVIYHT